MNEQQQSDKVTPTSRYVLLEKPSFASTIPAHMLARLSEQEKYLVETLSKMEQQNAWLAAQALATNKALVETDLRVQTIERVISMVRSKWSVLFWIITIVAPILLKLAFDWVAKHIP